ncbi:hypothetical protein JXA85_08330 [Candidatus Woesearchaeota archaeon]|nr:hypothetical protein [Candidatus Woesearchaeota archaeon]
MQLNGALWRAYREYDFLRKKVRKIVPKLPKYAFAIISELPLPELIADGATPVFLNGKIDLNKADLESQINAALPDIVKTIKKYHTS